MARRELWRRGISEWSRDTPSGWQGEHAADFIRQVLRPNAARRLSGGYPRAHVRVEEWRDRQPLSREAVERRVVGCAAGIGLIHDGPRTYLQSSTPNWRFENLYPMGQVFCLGTDIYVISQLLAQELYIDRLDVTGRLLGQWHASASRALDREHLPILHIASLGVEGHVMRLRLAWFEELPETGSLRLPEKSALLRLDMTPRHASDRGAANSP